MAIQAPQLEWIIAEATITRTPPKPTGKQPNASKVTIGRLKMSLGYKPRDAEGNPILDQGIEGWKEMKNLTVTYTLEDIFTFAMTALAEGSAYKIEAPVLANYTNPVHYLDAFLSDPLYEFVKFMVNTGKWVLE